MRGCVHFTEFHYNNDIENETLCELFTKPVDFYGVLGFEDTQHPDPDKETGKMVSLFPVFQFIVSQKRNQKQRSLLFSLRFF